MLGDPEPERAGQIINAKLEEATRPAVAKLAQGGGSGTALRLYLAALHQAAVVYAPGARTRATNDPADKKWGPRARSIEPYWACLAGHPIPDGDDRRAAKVAVGRALDKLQALGLIERTGPTTHGSALAGGGFQLLNPSTGRPYKIPRRPDEPAPRRRNRDALTGPGVLVRQPDRPSPLEALIDKLPEIGFPDLGNFDLADLVPDPHVWIPAQFWTNAWYRHLSPAAIHVYLALWESSTSARGDRFNESEIARRDDYGFTPDTVTVAAQELQVAALVTRRPGRDLHLDLAPRGLAAAASASRR